VDEEKKPHEPGGMGLQEAHFWIALTIFGSGVYLLRDEPLWGGPLFVVGIIWLIYSLRQHLAPNQYRLWIVTLAMAAATLTTGYDFYERFVSPPTAGSPPPNTEHANGVALFMQFSDQKTVPKEIRSINVRSWYALYTDSIYIRIINNGKDVPTDAAQVPPRWSVFILFDRPATFRQMLANCVGGELIKCDVATFTDQYAIVTVVGDVTHATLDITTQ
jgi:hypothetical protein